ncbi:MAG: PAS domain-containing protein, partial [Rubrivivax sp.]
MPIPPKTVEAPSALLPSRAALATLLDGVDDALLLFDDIGCLSFCNRAAMRLLGAEPGLSVRQLAGVLGDAGAAWLSERLATHEDAPQSTRVALADARAAQLSCWRVARDLALRVQVQVQAAGAPLPPSLPAVGPGPTLEMLRMLWASPFPATLQDGEFRLVAVNDAYLGFTGRTREALIGTDPVLLQPLEDQATDIDSRRELPERLAARAVPLLREQRLIDSSGRERWCRVTAYQVSAEGGQPLLLCVLQDSTAEHVARAQADRSLNELAQWFDLSPTGMLVFDEAGLIVR